VIPTTQICILRSPCPIESRIPKVAALPCDLLFKYI
jgi:hypothetical protein